MPAQHKLGASTGPAQDQQITSMGPVWNQHETSMGPALGQHGARSVSIHRGAQTYELLVSMSKYYCITHFVRGFFVIITRKREILETGDS